MVGISSFWDIILLIGYLSYKPSQTMKTSKWVAVDDTRRNIFFCLFGL